MHTRTVLDTNVIISGFFGTGVCSEVMNAVSRRLFVLALSEELFGELERIMVKLSLDAKLLAPLRAHAVIVTIHHEDAIVDADPDDDVLFWTALAAEAPFIVTQDKAVLAINHWRTVTVLPPGEFLRLLPQTR